MKKKVIIGMSGGVDSSVAAYLLKEQGYEVIGIMMKLASDELTGEDNDGGCCSLSAANDARRVADILDIPFYVMNFKESFKKNVVDSFIHEYLIGHTPNPCVQCNKLIKFNEFLKKAQTLGADYIATGHYAEVVEDVNGRYNLKCSNDEKKDQTYMLYNLTQEQLSHILMPCGKYNKSEIRDIAEKIGLHVFRKKDSQEICFIPDNNHGKFIETYTGKSAVPGNFVDENGNVVGKHKGICYYTIGQRKGLGLSLGKPVFIADIDPLTNDITVGDEKLIFKNQLIAGDVNYISIEKLQQPMEVFGKVRYSAKMAPCTIYPEGDNKVRVIFKDNQRAITKGQSVVFYKEDFVVGGGIIEKVF
ncbi:tRNA (5-methylaminomethyl-2-thiouridylate)-methyltransferase [Hathewaya proteolytica DSM 3090]|uniref:tRNA-specific 2-thiouridylase MnmA n=1 Tax=Hathewaya proteolytica DSM 3090 TaxID=1121331 RepID=A0A1M6JDF1_9CLOT|nr:tRNA 2-thiouridine(34) synthase MnmA [Hathewaya proteolytica]SHJ44741.1 tRNA (5-methylaminomethyl-2-thiouridylate)-methyltransferase [Hathewaya proteolytica DSM 3090]